MSPTIDLVTVMASLRLVVDMTHIDYAHSAFICAACRVALCLVPCCARLSVQNVT